MQLHVNTFTLHIVMKSSSKKTSHLFPKIAIRITRNYAKVDKIIHVVYMSVSEQLQYASSVQVLREKSAHNTPLLTAVSFSVETN